MRKEADRERKKRDRGRDRESERQRKKPQRAVTNWAAGEENIVRSRVNENYLMWLPAWCSGRGEGEYGKETDMLEQKTGEKSVRWSGRLGHRMKREQQIQKTLWKVNTQAQTSRRTERGRRKRKRGDRLSECFRSDVKSDDIIVAISLSRCIVLLSPSTGPVTPIKTTWVRGEREIRCSKGCREGVGGGEGMRPRVRDRNRIGIRRSKST